MNIKLPAEVPSDVKLRQIKEEAGRQPGPKLPGLTRTSQLGSQPRKRREGKIRFFSGMAGPNSADIEIGAWADWARGHMAKNK